MTVADYAKEIYDLLDNKESTYTDKEVTEESKRFWKNLEKSKGMPYTIEVTKKLCELIQAEDIA